jgi:hypothetical protein
MDYGVKRFGVIMSKPNKKELAVQLEAEHTNRCRKINCKECLKHYNAEFFWYCPRGKRR